MSEIQTRSGGTRGRGGARGGRGGFRGGRTSNRPHHSKDNDQENVPPVTLDEQGEVGELKKKFGAQVPLLREVCPGWSDEDLVYALQETNGDVEAAADRVSSGTISQWDEVKKKQPKAKETSSTTDVGATRGRGRGNFEGRGRGRGTERGARAARGGRAVSQTNGTKHANKTTNDGWDDSLAEKATAGVTARTNGDAADSTTETTRDVTSNITPKEAENVGPTTTTASSGKKAGGWASLFAKPPPATVPSVPVPTPQETSLPPASTSEQPITEEPMVPPPIEAVPIDETVRDLPSAPHSDTAADIIPSSDELTKSNLEQLPDESEPPPTATAASTVASTQDPLALGESSKPIIRPGMSGFAASALKATSSTARSSSYARKVLEQQEAVVMPGNHAVEKAAVQFGKMGLNGDDLDVDEEREEPETRTQMPDDSPSAPRASLPPAMSETQPAVPGQTSAETQQTRQAPGLPPAPQQQQQQQQQQQHQQQGGSAFNDQYRYGQGQKPYDPFGQQGQPQGQSQEPFSNQVPSQSLPATGSTQTDYASQYGRDAYQNYYGAYGQDTLRSGSTFGTSSQETPAQYATARQYGQEAQNSGNNTPNPAIPSHHAQHSQHLQQSQGHGGYPYGYPGAYNQQFPQYGGSYMNTMNHRYGANRPMFDDVRRENDYYGNQYGYGHNQQYGSSYKSNMYGQPQQYSYEHSSSPANAASFGGREGGYGRTGSAQPSEAQQSAASGSNTFSSVPDPFGRASSAFGQSPAMAQQHAQHQNTEESSKASGPSPSVQSGRPGSTVNNAPGQQGGLPPPQSQHSGQQAFSGYPQYGGGLGGLGGHQTSQNVGYNYGSNTAGFSSYGGYGGGRGWNAGTYGTGH